MGDLEFREHLGVLSKPLRRLYGLELGSESEAVLQNDIVRLKFSPGWPKDPYVSVPAVSYTDSTLLGDAKYFELRRYVDFTEAWHFFPTVWPNGRTRYRQVKPNAHSYIASPLQVLELVVFLAERGKAILTADRDEIDTFMAWVVDQDRQYNDRVSQKKSG